MQDLRPNKENENIYIFPCMAYSQIKKTNTHASWNIKHLIPFVYKWRAMMARAALFGDLRCFCCCYYYNYQKNKARSCEGF